MTRARDLADSADKDISGTLTLDDIVLSNDLTVADNGKAIFGAGSDLQIFHDGSNSFINNTVTGALSLKSDDINLMSSASETMATFVENGAVTLYHDNAAKLTTSSSGISVTGNVTASNSVGVNGSAGMPVLQQAAASASFPSYSFYDDGNTGMFRPSADALAFATGGSERMRIDSSGTVAIGTTDVHAWSGTFDGRLRIGDRGFLGTTSGSNQMGYNWYYDGAYKYIDADTANRYYQNGGNHVWDTAVSGSADGTITWSEKMTILNSGRVGIGTSSPEGSLHLTTKDINGSDVYMTVQNTTNNRVAGYQIGDENGTLSLEMKYDNGGNNATIRNPNNGDLSIYLGGTGAANQLSEYEQGTWTPSISTGGANVGYSGQNGQYTKIGREVYVNFQININSLTSSGSGSFQIGGLPFTPTSGKNSGRYVIQTHNVDVNSTAIGIYAYAASGTNLGVLYSFDNSGWSVASVSDFVISSSSIIAGSFHYISE